MGKSLVSCFFLRHSVYESNSFGFTRNHQVDWRLVAASQLSLLCTPASVFVLWRYDIGRIAVTIRFSLLLAVLTAGWEALSAIFTFLQVFVNPVPLLTSVDPCWKDLSESHHQYYNQTTCIHLPDSTHNSSTHADCCYCCRASLLPRQHKIVACTTGSELSIG